MITHPNCKINLGLHVMRKRPDGYHDLETIFLPMPLFDTLEITPSEQLTFLQEGTPLDCDKDHNLCIKALRLLKQDFPEMGNVAIRLKKEIPTGAGMGGGSADAAFTLKMLNELFSLHLGIPQLERYAASLGADCAFFIQNQPAYGTGIGDVLEPIDMSCLNGYKFVFVKPQEAVSTAEAYRGAKPRNKWNHNPQTDLREAVKRPVAEWKECIVNDFESSIFPNHVAIAHCKQMLYDSGALYASMTGSGATVFGIFPQESDNKPALMGNYYVNNLFVHF